MLIMPQYDYRKVSECINITITISNVAYMFLCLHLLWLCNLRSTLNLIITYTIWWIWQSLQLSEWSHGYLSWQCSQSRRSISRILPQSLCWWCHQAVTLWGSASWGPRSSGHYTGDSTHMSPLDKKIHRTRKRISLLNVCCTYMH